MTTVEKGSAVTAAQRPWYADVTGYQWLVLLIASLGWLFDVFESQVFVASSNEALPALAGLRPDDPAALFYTNVAFAAFLVGGAVGGIGFGMLGDRIGRVRTMMLTILLYSAFTCFIALAQNWTQLVLLFFLVAMGTGGEWAVASAMVAEVFPKRARAWSLGIFQGSSILGGWAAVAVGAWIVPNFGWRWAFVVGVFPALLTIWIYRSLHEPEKARPAADTPPAVPLRAGRLGDLFASDLLGKTLLGLALATVGLATYWGVFIHGRQILRHSVQNQYLAQLPLTASAEESQAILKEYADPIKHAEMLGMFLVGAGSGVGIVGFGPISERLGRRGAFLFFTLSAAIVGPLCYQALPGTPTLVICLTLPLFGFCTAGMHGGFAVYFPELFPTRLRATGGGFCFNGGRLLATPILLISGWMQHQLGLSLENTASILSILYLLGAGVSLLAPETKGHELPT